MSILFYLPSIYSILFSASFLLLYFVTEGKILCLFSTSISTQHMIMVKPTRFSLSKAYVDKNLTRVLLANVNKSEYITVEHRCMIESATMEPKSNSIQLYMINTSYLHMQQIEGMKISKQVKSYTMTTATTF